MDKDVVEKYVDNYCKKIVLPTFMDFIKIPNLSPNFDPNWNTNGFEGKAVELLRNWIDVQNIKGLKTNQIIKEKDRTSLLFVEIDKFNTESSKSILLYGHFDKQPPGTGWSPDHGPNDPVIINNKLYGRGSADDGNALFAVISAIRACQDNNYSHLKTTIIIEGAEESYEDDLLFYLNALQSKIGTPDLVICLDSGPQDYLRLWAMTSIRGILNLDLKVTILEQGIHSGTGGGIIPDSFMIIRELIDRIEDSNTGLMKQDFLYVDIPQDRKDDIDLLTKLTKDTFIKELPLIDSTQPFTDNVKDLIIRSTWMTCLTITGQSGFPESIKSGNVFRETTSLRLSFRLAPTLDAKLTSDKIIKILTDNPPFNAKVEVTYGSTGSGWNMKAFSDKLRTVMNEASQLFFNKDFMNLSSGATVPFLKTISKMYPNSEIVCTGAIGPDSKIHGPNESLDLGFFKKFICCLSYILNSY